LTPPAASLAPDLIVELGERILAELGDPRTNSTLARWLAHDTARLVQAADRAHADGDADADARADAARDAILRLWQARSSWPNGWPPPHAAEIGRLLDQLPTLDQDSGGWCQHTLLGRLQDIHLHLLGAVVDLAIDGAGEGELEAAWLGRFGDLLSADESALLRRAADRHRRMDALLLWWETLPSTAAGDEADGDVEVVDGSQAPSHPVMDLADAYRDTVLSMFPSDLDDGDAVDEGDARGGDI